MAGEGFEDPVAAGRVGGIASGDSRRQKREERRQAAEEKLHAALERAADVLVEAMEAQALHLLEGEEHYHIDHRARVLAADKLFDRTLGRPAQHHQHSGRVEVDIGAARAKLDGLLSKRSPDG